MAHGFRHRLELLARHAFAPGVKVEHHIVCIGMTPDLRAAMRLAGVEGDVYASRYSDDTIEMLLDRRLVERVNPGGLGASSACAYVCGDRLDGRKPASGQKDVRALAGECAGNSVPDSAARPIDDGDHVFEQPAGHVFLLVSGVSAMRQRRRRKETGGFGPRRNLF